MNVPLKPAKKEDDLCCPPGPVTSELSLQALEGAGADEDLAKLAKAIGHPARVRILRMLSRKEARVCSQIVDELPLAQSTVSEHLRILKDAGLVRSAQDGPRVGYCIDFDGLRRLKALVAII
jgi:ArsR family transcriptional regulator, arsenate/arsenite/antimonite-responsive transcriptional repressor